jgi:cation diffusion facilitator family transporter
MSSHEGSVKVVVVALLSNLGIAASKFVGALITGSASLFAEAIHSVVDCSNQVLLLIGSRQAKRPESDLHPMGHGREAFFWSFIVAVLLFSLGGLFAVYEGVHKLSHHEPLESPIIGLAILIFGFGLEAISFHACLKEVRLVNTEKNLWRWFQNTTSTELLVIFTEDLAAMAGLGIAATCLSLTWATGNPTWDAAGSILVGIVLVVVALLLAVEIKSLIIGEAPRTDFESSIKERITQHIAGGKLLRLIALQVGANEVMLSYKIHPGTVKDVETLVNGINQIESEIKLQFPQVKWQFVEPDFTD